MVRRCQTALVRIAAATIPASTLLVACACALALCADAAMATISSPVASSDEQRARLQVDLGVHSAPVRRLSIDSGKAIAVTASDDKTARIWDLASGPLQHVQRPGVGAGELGRLYGAALHPQEPLVAVGGTTGAAGGFPPGG